MSIHVISPVMRKRWGSSCRKLVAIKLADVANDDGSSIFPAVQTIANECEMSKRQVQRVMAEFQNEGLLVLVKEGGNGPGSTNEYQLNLTKIGLLPDAKEKGDTQSSMTLSKGDTQSQKGCHPVTQPVIDPITLSYDNGAEAPSTSSLVWKEGSELLAIQEPNHDCKNRKLIGSWLKRAASDDDKAKLLAIIRAAAKAGTHDPVSYISKAVNETWPPPPDPKKFTVTDWEPRIETAIRRQEWSNAWGPPPGKRGCVVPPDLITPDLLNAMAQGSQ